MTRTIETAAPVLRSTERRPAIEARGEGEDKQETITGYAAVFHREDDEGTTFKIWDDLWERIIPGAFDRAIQEDDVRSLFNHDENIVLGRKGSGTLELSVDAVGLMYRVTPPATEYVRGAVLEPIRRGDVSGSSFMFVPRTVRWVEHHTEDGRRIDVRELVDVELWEVGPVVFPAYGSTSSAIRGAQAAELRAARDLRRAEIAQADADAEWVRIMSQRVELARRD